MLVCNSREFSTSGSLTPLANLR